MRDADFDKFAAHLDGVCGLLSRGAYQPNPQNTAIFFRALARYDLKTVTAGLDAHVCDPKHGRFVPTPADVIGQIEGFMAKDGRPEADEAWAIAVTSVDEDATVVWTEETAQAWAVAKSVMDMGDEVGARMAFKAAYSRFVEEARATRSRTQWAVSLGADKSRQAAALTSAVAQNRLGREMLPAPELPNAGLLGLTTAQGCPADVRQKLLELAESLRESSEGISVDYANKISTDFARSIEAEKVRLYQEQHMMPDAKA